MTFWASFVLLLSCQVGLSSAGKVMSAPWSVGSDYCVGVLLLIALWTLCIKHSSTINIYLNICYVLLTIIYKDLPFLTKKNKNLCVLKLCQFSCDSQPFFTGKYSFARVFDWFVPMLSLSGQWRSLCWSEIPVKSVGCCSCSSICPNILTLRVKTDTNFLTKQERADGGGCQPKGQEHLTAFCKVSVWSKIWSILKQWRKVSEINSQCYLP